MNLPVIPFLLSIPLFFYSSSDYIRYYNLFNQAKVLYSRGEVKEALSNMHEAFDVVEYIHNEKLLFAAEMAVKMKEYNLANRYVRTAFTQGVLLEAIEKDSVYKEFIRTSYFRKLKTNYISFREKYLDAFNKTYAAEIDSLYYIDQFILRSSTVVGTPGKTYLIPKREEGVVITDSAVFSTFMNLVRKHGFPTERSVGRESLRGAYIMILHSVRMPKNQFYLTELRQLLQDGKFHPAYYAWTYDQAMKSNKQELVYYYGMQYDKSKITDSLLTEINQHRTEIGLELLELNP